jgi:hypothetical protein
MRKHYLICIMILSMSGCVSVELPNSKTTSAKDVQWKAPGSPFKEIKATNADKTWLSSRTGNTISFLSECGNAADPSLQSLESESLSALGKITPISSRIYDFNGRAARNSVSSGEVDGVPVQLELLVFKKNGCNYTLSYGGVMKQYEAEHKIFEDFKQNFKAP